jgi:hypothetical protein
VTLCERQAGAIEQAHVDAIKAEFAQMVYKASTQTIESARAMFDDGLALIRACRLSALEAFNTPLVLSQTLREREASAIDEAHIDAIEEAFAQMLFNANPCVNLGFGSSDPQSIKSARKKFDAALAIICDCRVSALEALDGPLDPGPSPC